MATSVPDVEWFVDKDGAHQRVMNANLDLKKVKHMVLERLLSLARTCVSDAAFRRLCTRTPRRVIRNPNAPEG
jgi:hypothetical protein